MNDDPLYQAEILALARDGRSLSRLDRPTVSARVDNPICGDRVTIDLAIEGDTVIGVGAKVQGCALCQAAAAIIAQEAVGVRVGKLLNSAEIVAAYLSGRAPEADLPWIRLSNFAPVRDARSRHDCVMLPFRATVKALASRETLSS